MKRLLLFTFFVFALTTSWSKDNQLTITPRKVELIITAKTTNSQLKKFQKTLKEDANIDFSYQNIIVNSKKQISEITITVDSNDGIKGSKRLIISNIYEVGFVRNYLEKTNDKNDIDKVLFIGNIREKEIKLK